MSNEAEAIHEQARRQLQASLRREQEMADTLRRCQKLCTRQLEQLRGIRRARIEAESTGCLASDGGPCGDPCPVCGACRHRDNAAPCCNPKCRGVWGTGCYHCHHSKYMDEEQEERTWDDEEQEKTREEYATPAPRGSVRE